MVRRRAGHAPQTLVVYPPAGSRKGDEHPAPPLLVGHGTLYLRQGADIRYGEEAGVLGRQCLVPVTMANGRDTCLAMYVIEI